MYPEPKTLEITIEGMVGETIQEVVSNLLFLLNKAPDIKMVTFRCGGEIIDVELIHHPLEGWMLKEIKYDLYNDGRRIIT